MVGVVVNETTSDTPIATLNVTANSRNNLPTMPPIISRGMNTATRDVLIDTTVNPISDAPLNVLALNASLKHEPTLSNTGELASLVLDEIRALASVSANTVRLSDATLPVGLGFREAAEDDWPDLVTKIKTADIVLFCTPIWWGGRLTVRHQTADPRIREPRRQASPRPRVHASGFIGRCHLL